MVNNWEKEILKNNQFSAMDDLPGLRHASRDMAWKAPLLKKMYREYTNIFIPFYLKIIFLKIVRLTYKQ